MTLKNINNHIFTLNIREMWLYIQFQMERF